MRPLQDKVVEITDKQVTHLVDRSKQETRISIFFFESNLTCHSYDTDVLRLPSIKDKYRTGGGTSLIDATTGLIRKLKKIPELFGDHPFCSTSSQTAKTLHPS